MPAVTAAGVPPYYYGFRNASQARSVVIRLKMASAAGGFILGRSYGDSGHIIGLKEDANGGHPRIQMYNSAADVFSADDSDPFVSGAFKSFGHTFPGGNAQPCKLYGSNGLPIGSGFTLDSNGGSDEFYLFTDNAQGDRVPVGTILDQIKLFTSVLSDAQMKNEILYRNVQNPSTCFGNYLFPNGTGLTAGLAQGTDASGNGHDLSFLSSTLVYSSDAMSLPLDPPTGSSRSSILAA